MAGEEIPEPARDLLAAVLEAIDLPFPSTAGDTGRYRELLEERALHAATTLRAVLDDESPLGAAWEADHLRRRLAEHPPTGYRHAPRSGR